MPAFTEHVRDNDALECTSPGKLWGLCLEGRLV